MILDTSAVVAIIRAEPEAERFLEIMRDAESLSMGAPTAVELSLVVRPERVDRAMDLLEQAGVRIVDFTRDHLLVAQHGLARYGRGSGSLAKLNFGDCLAYALSKSTGEPLLFKGEDFTHTDVTPAR